MVFDWDRAARRIVEANAGDASAGLESDWEWTGGPILANGVPVPASETCVYLASTWATPILSLDGVEEPCWRYQTDDGNDWNADTYWPDSALTILTESTDE